MKIRKFDLDIYTVSIIKKAVLDYSHIAKIVVTPKKKHTVCHFLWCKADEERTVDEFSNYLIDLISVRGNAHDRS